MLIWLIDIIGIAMAVVASLAAFVLLSCGLYFLADNARSEWKAGYRSAAVAQAATGTLFASLLIGLMVLLARDIWGQSGCLEEKNENDQRTSPLVDGAQGLHHRIRGVVLMGSEAARTGRHAKARLRETIPRRFVVNLAKKTA